MLKMELEQSNIPLAGDILDDLAMAFREIIAKVSRIELHAHGWRLCTQT